MRKIVDRITQRLLPKATGKATSIQGACYSGCGGDGVWIAASGKRPANGKVPCC